MEKETKYSFIAEFDEMTDKQINNLTDYFDNNKIKFHVIKSDHELKIEKEIIDKAIEYINVHKRKDEFLDLNEWQTRDLLSILEDKEVKE